MRTEVEVLEAKVRLLNQAIEVLTDMKDDLEKENKELKEHERTMEDSWQRLYGEKKQLEEWLEEETLKLQETEEYCQDLYLENKELKKDNERLTNTTNNNYEFMMIYKNKYHELLENVNNLIHKYERGDCDDCK